MRRTQVYLDEELVAGLQRLARTEGTSMGELIRRGARRLLQETVATEPWGAADPLWDLVGFVSGGAPDDASLNADRYLYGERADDAQPRARVAEGRAVYDEQRSSS